MDLIKIVWQVAAASNSWSLCRSLTSISRKLCTCKLLQVQSFIIVSQNLRITLSEFVFPTILQEENFHWHLNFPISLMANSLCFYSAKHFMFRNFSMKAYIIAFRKLKFAKLNSLDIFSLYGSPSWWSLSLSCKLLSFLGKVILIFFRASCCYAFLGLMRI